MPQIARLTADDRDDLVAYLDGELDDDAGDRIERALAASPVARHEVEMLTRTWDLLDLLPAADPDRSFTERTLAAAKAQEVRTPLADRPAARLARRVGLAAIWTAAVAAAAAVGFQAARRWVPRETDPVVRDYPVLSELPRLRDAGSAEFLELLTRERLLNDLPPDLDPATSDAEGGR